MAQTARRAEAPRSRDVGFSPPPPGLHEDFEWHRGSVEAQRQQRPRKPICAEVTTSISLRSIWSNSRAINYAGLNQRFNIQFSVS